MPDDEKHAFTGPTEVTPEALTPGVLRTGILRHGSVLVRGFAPAVFTLLNTSPNAAVHKAASVGQPVTQEIAWRVKSGRAECSINGTVVAGYDKAQLIGAGKLRSTDGVYGIRFTHNVEAVITGFSMTKG